MNGGMEWTKYTNLERPVWKQNDGDDDDKDSPSNLCMEACFYTTNVTRTNSTVW